MKIPRRKLSSAFTLLEIMVAIALLAMVVGAIYSSWNAILKGSTTSLNVAAKAQRSRITLRTLQDSLICACMFNAGTSNYYFLGSMDGEDSSLSFVAHLPKSFLRHGKFGDLNVRRINFKVEAGTDSKKQLVMRQQPLVMGIDDDESRYPLVLATDISQFKVEYLDPKTGDFVTDWEYTNQLPHEIRISIGLGRKDSFSSEPQDTLFAMVAIPANAVRAEWQMPLNGQVPGANPPGGGANGTTPINGGGNPQPLPVH